MVKIFLQHRKSLGAEISFIIPKVHCLTITLEKGTSFILVDRIRFFDFKNKLLTLLALRFFNTYGIILPQNREFLEYIGDGSHASQLIHIGSTMFDSKNEVPGMIRIPKSLYNTLIAATSLCTGNDWKYIKPSL